MNGPLIKKRVYDPKLPLSRNRPQIEPALTLQKK